MQGSKVHPIKLALVACTLYHSEHEAVQCKPDTAQEATCDMTVQVVIVLDHRPVTWLHKAEGPQLYLQRFSARFYDHP